LQATAPAEGSSGVLYPGEIEHRRELDRRAHGVEVEDATWRKLLSLAREYGVNAPTS
jgi:LDH2 family malate/lactate/ureidoglycolate dehydrogenase